MPVPLASMPGKASITKNQAPHFIRTCLSHSRNRRTQLSIITPHSSIYLVLSHSQHQPSMAPTTIRWQLHLLHFLPSLISCTVFTSKCMASGPCDLWFTPESPRTGVQNVTPTPMACHICPGLVLLLYHYCPPGMMNPPKSLLYMNTTEILKRQQSQRLCCQP